MGAWRAQHINGACLVGRNWRSYQPAPNGTVTRPEHRRPRVLWGPRAVLQVSTAAQVIVGQASKRTRVMRQKTKRGGPTHQNLPPLYADHDGIVNDKTVSKLP